MTNARSRQISKAVIPAAGLGTRFLPATKATPKEMLPVVDKPAIQYVVEEAASAGLTDVLMITGRNKRPLEDHFDRAYELEEQLARKGDQAKLDRVRESSELATMHYVRQGDPKGLGHAVLCAEPHVADQPFAVLLGDDLIDPRDPLLAKMIEIQSELGGSVVALIEVDPALAHLYGCASVRPAEYHGPHGVDQDVVRITDLVEKPAPGEAPSNFAVIGRYVLDPSVFDVLRETEPGKNGEIQLTDALRVLAQRTPGRGGPVHGVIFRGRRYDTGDKGDYLRAIVRLACEREDLGPEFRAWLKEFVGSGELDGPIEPF
ncbi:UTP--glucose-1-phosphate uridylyltransferase GalU [Streptacidiphilus jiangxiensis]|uniref:UTP--glucose-1-phosphate uridylyltransferase n=1 Tax=Streptacidiphilus jiangxiensis TaxID=235985 RepID=A0A1H7F9S1_STRJI|nr:UTP--glucose-1-phosphate uridylyltransferase GalU [Streptacidiphilus jiangxiensis]SEK22846.1 UTP--glucose-1-phosphate uridylyltransferase [Streptacidiphilus jiangxiensis]